MRISISPFVLSQTDLLFFAPIVSLDWVSLFCTPHLLPFFVVESRYFFSLPPTPPASLYVRTLWLEMEATFLHCAIISPTKGNEETVFF